MTTTEPPGGDPTRNGRAGHPRQATAGRPRRRRHPASVSRITIAGISAASTLLLTAGFAVADGRRSATPPPPSSGAPAATVAPNQAVTGWDNGGATGAATQDPSYYYTPPDTQTQSS